MSEPGNPHAWITEKKSWLITVNAESMSTFEPMDPPTGIWTRSDLTRHLGPDDLTVLPLPGRWHGEVLIAGNDPGRPDHFHNELADNLCREALGNYHRLYGPVLMTRMELLAVEVRVSHAVVRCPPADSHESGCRPDTTSQSVD
jgi:hypothetical protein